MARKCGNCGEEGHNSRTCSVVTPTPQTPAQVGSPITVKGLVKKDAWVSGVTKLPNGRVKLMQQVNPTRVERFEEVIKRLKTAARNQKVYFKAKSLGKKTVPVPKGYIYLAEKNLLNGARKNKEGNWVWDYDFWEIEMEDPWPQPDFEYIGNLQIAADDKNFDPQNPKFTAYWIRPHLVDATLDRLDPEIEKVAAPSVAKIIERGIAASKDKTMRRGDFSPNLYCDKCNPFGDDVPREKTKLYLVMNDIPDFEYGNEGRLDKNRVKYSLKEGDVIELGSGCEDYFVYRDVKDIAMLYGDYRAKAQYGSIQSPGSKAGWGWSEMDVQNHILRQCQIYGRFEELWLKQKRRALFQVSPKEIYAKGTYTWINPINKNLPYGYNMKDDVGMWLANGGGWMLKARMFEITDPNTQEKKTYFQPFDNMGGVKEMVNGLADGSIPYDLVDVPIMNDETGLPVLDDDGNIQYESVRVPSSEWLYAQMRMKYKKKGLYTDKIYEAWSPSKAQPMAEEVREYVLNLDLKNLPESITDVMDASQVVNAQKLIDFTVVGKKSEKIANDIWRIWALGNYEKRANVQKEKYKESMVDWLNQQGIVGSWIKKPSWLRDYNDWGKLNIPTPGAFTRYSYNKNRVEFAKRSFEDEIYLSPQEVTQMEANRQSQLEMEKRRREEARINNLISGLPRKRTPSTSYYGRTYYNDYANWFTLPSGVSYDNDEILDLLGWGALKGEQEKATSLVTVNANGLIYQMKLYEPEEKVVKDYLNQKLMSMAGLTQAPAVPAPTTSAPAPTPVATDKKPKITSDQAQNVLRQAKNKNPVAAKGSTLTDLTGYVVAKNGNFRASWGSRSGKMCQYIKIVTDDGKRASFIMAYNVEDVPSIGDYIKIPTAEVGKYDPRYGGQTALDVPMDGVKKNNA